MEAARYMRLHEFFASAASTSAGELLPDDAELLACFADVIEAAESMPAAEGSRAKGAIFAWRNALGATRKSIAPSLSHPTSKRCRCSSTLLLSASSTRAV